MMEVPLRRVAVPVSHIPYPYAEIEKGMNEPRINQMHARPQLNRWIEDNDGVLYVDDGLHLHSLGWAMSDVNDAV